MINPVIYVICDKYEFLNSFILTCYRVPKLNYKFEGLTANFQGMTLLVNFKQKIEEKNVLEPINVSVCPKIWQCSFLFDKEMDMLFRARLQNQTCLKTSEAVSVPKQ